MFVKSFFLILDLDFLNELLSNVNDLRIQVFYIGYWIMVYFARLFSFDSRITGLLVYMFLTIARYMFDKSPMKEIQLAGANVGVVTLQGSHVLCLATRLSGSVP